MTARGRGRSFARFTSSVRTLLRFRLRELARMAHALVLLGVAELLLRALPVERAAGFMGAELGLDRSEPLHPGHASWFRLSDDERLSIRCVRRVSRHLHGADAGCLRRCLALGRLLRHRSTVMRIGVIRADCDLRAHAWLEVDGVSLEDVRGFVAMESSSR